MIAGKVTWFWFWWMICVLAGCELVEICGLSEATFNFRKRLLTDYLFRFFDY